MMAHFLAYASPFKTFEEFTAAEGPIYTYAQAPGFLGFLLIISALIALYFIYASFKIKAGESEAKSPVVLSILLALSAVSLADRLYTHTFRDSDRPTTSAVRAAEAKTASTSGVPSLLKPFALLGLVGSGAISSRRPTTMKRQSRRSFGAKQAKHR